MPTGEFPVHFPLTQKIQAITADELTANPGQLAETIKTTIYPPHVGSRSSSGFSLPKAAQGGFDLGVSLTAPFEQVAVKAIEAWITARTTMSQENRDRWDSLMVRLAEKVFSKQE